MSDVAIKIINRGMNIPASERIIGYIGDNLVEVRMFELPRFYGDVDLAEFDFKLDTQSGDGDVKNIIDLDKTVADDKITLTWTVKESHILNLGHMSIQIRAFSAGEEKWHSARDYVKVQPSINAEQSIPDPLPSEFVQMEQRVTVAKNAAEEAAQMATEQAGIVQQIVERAEIDVLPVLNQSIEDAGQAKDSLDGSIEEAGTIKTNLDGSIEAAGEAKTDLDGVITQAGTVKGQLDGSITQAGTKKTELDGSITVAGQVKEALDESIATGDLAAFRQEFTEHKNDFATYRDNNNLKISKVEKELSDYKSTMATLNPNQEAKQTATGYGAVALPVNAVNGQVSDVSLKGLTATQLTQNGDFVNGTTGWQILAGESFTVVNGIAEYVANAQYGRLTHHANRFKTVIGNRVYRYGLVKSNSNQVGLTGGSTGVALHSGSGNFERLSFIRTATENYEFSGVSDNRTSDWDKIYIDSIGSIDLTATFGAGNEPTKEQCDQMFPYYFDGTKSTISAGRLVSANEDETEKTYQYYPDCGLLRSLPNGTNDEISGSVHTQRIGTKANVASGTVIDYADMADGGQYYAWNDEGETETGVKGDTLGIDATELTYQLASPIVTPINVTGTLVGHPNGNVYWEPVLPVAGIYTGGIAVTDTDFPIDYIEKISKIDFMTGLETEVDVSQAVISGDGLSFTHAELVDGDIVFFTYYHSVTGTLPEISATYFDSRFVLKDSVTGKFYKWSITVTNGTPSIQLTEV